MIARIRATPETHLDRRVREIVTEMVQGMEVQLRQNGAVGLQCGGEDKADPLAALQVVFADMCCECAHGQTFAHPEMRDTVFKTLTKIQDLRERIIRTRQEARRRRSRSLSTIRSSGSLAGAGTSGRRPTSPRFGYTRAKHSSRAGAPRPRTPR